MIEQLALSASRSLIEAWEWEQICFSPHRLKEVIDEIAFNLTYQSDDDIFIPRPRLRIWDLVLILVV